VAAADGMVDQPCVCAARGQEGSGRDCKITTRVNVILPAVPVLGVWRLETHGYYAAVELPGVLEVIGAAARQGVILPGTLRIEQRSVKRPGEGLKRFPVPVLDVQVPVRELMAAGNGRTTEASAPKAISAPKMPALPAGPALPSKPRGRKKEPTPDFPEPPPLPNDPPPPPEPDPVVGLSDAQRGLVFATANDLGISSEMARRIARYRTDGLGVSGMAASDIDNVLEGFKVYAEHSVIAEAKLLAWEAEQAIDSGLAEDDVAGVAS
jgi:hypothetical protein